MTDTDLIARINAELNDMCSDSCADAAKAVVRAVLELHPLDDDHMCIKDIVGYSVQVWYDDEPCPTVLAVAAALGIGEPS